MGMNRETLPAPSREGDAATPGGVPIHYRCWGTGPALILLHGNGEDYKAFRAQIAPFSEYYAIVAVDSRGHGSSGMGEPFSLSGMAEDVLSVMDALGLEKASVCGFSDGGNVALYFALRHPSRIEKLVLAGANLDPAGLAPRVLAQTRLEWGFAALCGRLSEAWRRRARVLRLMLDEPHIDPWELETIEAPVLVIAGQHDMILQPHTELIAKSIPNAHLRIIPACGHFVFRDSPEWVNETVLRFLRGQ